MSGAKSSHLRSARAELVASLIHDHQNSLLLIEETYKQFRDLNGLTRQQLDQAVDDLVEDDRAELINTDGLLLVQLVREAGE